MNGKSIMKKNICAWKCAAAITAVAAAVPAYGNQEPSGNTNPAYAPSGVQAQLRLNIRDGAEAVHFIRDTNAPKIITKAYVLKHADPYSIRPYVREMVQALKVDYNNEAGRGAPDYFNTYSKDNAAGTRKIFVPTGVECVKFADGTGVLIVSAEAYRFASSPNGMGIDELVAALDQPGMLNSSGQPKFVYFPRYRSAKELKNMVKLVGANVSNDTAELIGGKDKIEADEALNCLFFNTALYSRKNIETVLKAYDVPLPQVRIRCRVYEIEAENDGALGFDFQSWKNNDGVKFLQTGAKLSRNYNVKDVLNAVRPDGTINTHYFNFEPKWNTRFLDFLVSKGKAKIYTTGELTIRSGAAGTLERSGGIMIAAVEKIEPEKMPDGSKQEHGNAVDIKPANRQFHFKMTAHPSVTEKAAELAITVSTCSMLGITSAGNVRTSDFATEQKIQLGTGKNVFYLGGIEKSETVRVSNGIPLLKDLPLLGWIFSTERESARKSRLVVVAECETVRPDSGLESGDAEKTKAIRANAGSGAEGPFNEWGYRQWLLDGER